MPISLTPTNYPTQINYHYYKLFVLTGVDRCDMLCWTPSMIKHVVSQSVTYGYHLATVRHIGTALSDFSIYTWVIYGVLLWQ